MAQAQVLGINSPSSLSLPNPSPICEKVQLALPSRRIEAPTTSHPRLTVQAPFISLFLECCHRFLTGLLISTLDFLSSTCHKDVTGIPLQRKSNLLNSNQELPISLINSQRSMVFWFWATFPTSSPLILACSYFYSWKTARFAHLWITVLPSSYFRFLNMFYFSS